eukprot:gnl/Dysnectes_brevis/1160_a1294_3323.p1 GENE.gnl/Dysnectes_brevis/1160_a1294_3323~~gnl/Dysnectes_brevis/1160_a1294_3323.p1  ORF type:complete len:199 (+),score=14.59 gnl/Dysnectes_brevis/1160_a1294_3323:180-776(+)
MALVINRPVRPKGKGCLCFGIICLCITGFFWALPWMPFCTATDCPDQAWGYSSGSCTLIDDDWCGWSTDCHYNCGGWTQDICQTGDSYMNTLGVVFLILAIATTAFGVLALICGIACAGGSSRRRYSQLSVQPSTVRPVVPVQPVYNAPPIYNAPPPPMPQPVYQAPPMAYQPAPQVINTAPSPYAYQSTTQNPQPML